MQRNFSRACRRWKVMDAVFFTAFILIAVSSIVLANYLQDPHFYLASAIPIVFAILMCRFSFFVTSRDSWLQHSMILIGSLGVFVFAFGYSIAGLIIIVTSIALFYVVIYRAHINDAGLEHVGVVACLRSKVTEAIFYTAFILIVASSIILASYLQNPLLYLASIVPIVYAILICCFSAIRTPRDPWLQHLMVLVASIEVPVMILKYYIVGYLIFCIIAVLLYVVVCRSFTGSVFREDERVQYRVHYRARANELPYRIGVALVNLLPGFM